MAQSTQASCTPSISYWSLLDAVAIDYLDARLTLGKLYAVCLPQPARASESNYAYSPDGGGRLTTVVMRANGQVLNTYVWYGENVAGLWELSRYKVIGGFETVRPLVAGDYLLEFQLENKPFYRFPFSVFARPADDPYQPTGPRYFIDGPWNEYGNLFYQRNDPKSSLRFVTWVRNAAGHDGKRSAPYQVRLLRGDGRSLASENGTLNLEPHWRQADLFFKAAGVDGFFKAEEILRTDGVYRVQLEIDGKPYGSYPFTVQGGKIQLQGRQIKEHTDMQLFIFDYLYGGRYTSWWIKREDGHR
jgi:hypothetical protein